MDNYELGGGFKHFLCSPLFGEDSHFDEYFSDGLKPPTSEVLNVFFCLLRVFGNMWVIFIYIHTLFNPEIRKIFV